MVLDKGLGLVERDFKGRKYPRGDSHLARYVGNGTRHYSWDSCAPYRRKVVRLSSTCDLKPFASST